jgi:hypothetical protein
LFDLPTLIRLPLQFLLWAWVILLPGLFAALWIVRRREASSALVAALSLGFGLVVVPVLAHALLYVFDLPLSILALVVPATVVNGLGAAWWWRRERPLAVISDGPWLWLGLAGLAVAYFVTADGKYPVVSVDHWKAVGTVNCFMEALCKYVGIHSHPHLEQWAGVPPWQHIDEKLTMANLLPTGAHAVLFGAPGFRVLRAVLAVLLGALGWVVWSHLGGPRRGALVGLVFFGANPLVWEILNVDRNVLALAFAALLYVLADKVRAGPIVLGLTAGLTGGFGIRLLPVVYLLPLGLHLWSRHGRRLRDLAVFAAASVSTLSISAVVFLRSALRDYSDLAPLLSAGVERRLAGFRSVGSFSYELFGASFESHYALAFPFGATWVRGPYDPLPVFLFWPAHVYQALGALVLALALVGAWATWCESRARALTMVAWGVPAYLGLSLLAFLIDPIQERLILVALLPVLVFTLKGLLHVVAARRTLAAVGVVGLALVGVGVGASFVDVPLDVRLDDANFQEYWFGDEGLVGADPALVIRKRLRYRDPQVLPNYSAWAAPDDEQLASSSPAYLAHAAAFDAWTDFREPDLKGRCFFCDTGALP